jgi:hypothetical protein
MLVGRLKRKQIKLAISKYRLTSDRLFCVRDAVIPDVIVNLYAAKVAKPGDFKLVTQGKVVLARPKL